MQEVILRILGVAAFLGTPKNKVHSGFIVLSRGALVVELRMVSSLLTRLRGMVL